MQALSQCNLTPTQTLTLNPPECSLPRVTISFRGGFIGGVPLAICIGLYLVWLWQPERQAKRHTENLFRAIERRDWEAAADFIGNDYQDQWGDDRARVLERLREGLRYARGLRITASNPNVQVEASAEMVKRLESVLAAARTVVEKSAAAQLRDADATASLVKNRELVALAKQTPDLQERLSEISDRAKVQAKQVANDKKAQTQALGQLEKNLASLSAK